MSSWAGWYVVENFLRKKSSRFVLMRPQPIRGEFFSAKVKCRSENAIFPHHKLPINAMMESKFGITYDNRSEWVIYAVIILLNKFINYE